MEINTTEEQLKKILKEIFKEILPAFCSKELPDNLALNDALEMLRENGYIISKAQIYKLTSAKEVPHKIFGNKLVFSRRELLEWAAKRVKEKKPLTDGYLFGRNRLRRKK